MMAIAVLLLDSAHDSARVTCSFFSKACSTSFSFFDPSDMVVIVSSSLSYCQSSSCSYGHKGED